MSRTRVRRRRAAAIGVGIVIAIVAPRAAALGGDAAPARRPGRVHVVRPGDTVWDIAQSEAGGSDPRPLVDAIVEANGLGGSSIVPGQPLVVPDR
jgi:Tfp pilus assembly protein FimV